MGNDIITLPGKILASQVEGLNELGVIEMKATAGAGYELDNIRLVDAAAAYQTYISHDKKYIVAHLGIEAEQDSETVEVASLLMPLIEYEDGYFLICAYTKRIKYNINISVNTEDEILSIDAIQVDYSGKILGLGRSELEPSVRTFGIEGDTVSARTALDVMLETGLLYEYDSKLTYHRVKQTLYSNGMTIEFVTFDRENSCFRNIFFDWNDENENFSNIRNSTTSIGGDIPLATTSSDGLMSSTDKAKLDDLEVDYSKQYLTFVALEDGTFTFTGSGISYSIDGGVTWISLAANTASPTVYVGNKIMWKASLTPTSSAGIGTFNSTAQFDVVGNIMSLLFGDDFKGVTDLTGKNYAFNRLFNYCTNVVNAENMALPATTLTSACYQYMFYGCTSLTTAPSLPARTLSGSCYNSMFNGCESLTAAPELPATTMAASACTYMFNGCTSLTTAPELPATTLETACYKSMFSGCTSLTTAPELPATTLVSGCYDSMFWGCTRLTTAPELPATTLASSCYYGMFQGCTSLTTAPELPATTLVSNCYSNMFYGCTKLNYIKAMFTTTPSTTYTNNWVANVASKGTFIKTRYAPWELYGTYAIPTGWTPYLAELEWEYAHKYEVNAKQDTLVSGTNIKTINNQSLLGSGNITIEGGSGGGEANVIETVKVNGTTLTPDSNKAVNIPLATTSADGLMSFIDKSKVDSIKEVSITQIPSGSTSDLGTTIKVGNDKYHIISDISETATQHVTAPSWGVIKQLPAYNITSSDITTWNNKSDFSGSYNDLSNKPTIPTNYAGSPEAGGTANKTASIPYAQVDSTSTATVFTATVDGITELRDGVCCLLKNGIVTSASGFTLNVNNLGAKPCYTNLAAATRESTIFNTTYTMLFVYDSTRGNEGGWICYRGYDSNSDVEGYNIREYQTGSKKLKTTMQRYQLVMTTMDEMLLPVYNGAYTTATTKVLTTESFNPFGQIYYYGATDNIAAGGGLAAGKLYVQATYNVYPDLRYSFNTGSTLTAGDDIYLVCVPQSDGSVKLHTSPIAKSLPTTEDGLVYKRLGRAHDTNKIILELDKPCYYYKNGAVRLWTNGTFGVKMNGTTNSPTDGVVDLGTVITSETSLSKGTTTGTGNAVTDISVSGHRITLTKGTTFLTQHQDISGKANTADLATVATSGSYNDLTDKPTIPSAPGTLNTTATAAQSTSSSQSLSGNITLHKISKTGSYNDLNNKPTIPTVNDPTITLTFNGSTVGTFTLNQSGNQTIDIGSVIGLPSFSAANNGQILGVVNGALAWITPTTIYTGTGTPSSSQGNDGDIYLQTS